MMKMDPITDDKIKGIISNRFGSEGERFARAISSLRDRFPKVSPGGEPYWLNYLGQMVDRIDSSDHRAVFDEIAGHYGFGIRKSSRHN
jgi:hypothetical protein